MREHRLKAVDLRAIRKEAGLTQGQLAERSGVSRQTIVALERPGRSGYASTIRKLAAALDVGVEDLIGEPGRKQARRNDLLRSLADHANYVSIRLRGELIRVLEMRDELGLEMLKKDGNLAALGALLIIDMDDREGDIVRPTEEARRIRVDAQKAVARLNSVVDEVDRATIEGEEERDPIVDYRDEYREALRA
jgi:putative transcriptional regulator